MSAVTAAQEREARERIIAARNSLVVRTHEALAENMIVRDSVAVAREQLRELRVAVSAYRAAGLDSDLVDDVERLYRRYVRLFTEAETIVAHSDGSAAALSRALAASLERVARDRRGLEI